MKKMRALLVVAMFVATMALAGCGGNTLDGTYAASANHTFDFDRDGTCIMQDNGVSWPGEYKYDSSGKAYEIVVTEAFGVVERFTAVPEGDDLVITYPNGNSSTYEKQ